MMLALFEKKFGLDLTNRQKMTIRILVGLAVFSPFAVSWGQAPSNTVEAGSKLQTVRVVEIQTSPSFETKRYFTGEICSKRTSVLGFERLGRVTRKCVDDGDVVEKKKVIAELDDWLLHARRIKVKPEL